MCLCMCKCVASNVQRLCHPSLPFSLLFPPLPNESIESQQLRHLTGPGNGVDRVPSGQIVDGAAGQAVVVLVRS